MLFGRGLLVVAGIRVWRGFWCRIACLSHATGTVALLFSYRLYWNPMYEPVLIRHILTCVVWRFGTVRRAAQCMATCHFEDMPIVLYRGV